MKNSLKFLPYTIFFILVAINNYLWTKIELPYFNPGEVIGIYSENNYNSQNDTLRFILYILTPLIVYFIFYSLLNKNKFSELKNKFIFNKKEENFIYYKQIFFLLLILILFSYLSNNLPNYKLDIFHELHLLSGAYNLLEKNQFWKGSFIQHGLFYDQINTVLSFKIFGIKSIGAYRIFQNLLNYFTSIFLILLCFSVSKHLRLEKKLKFFFIIFLTLTALYLLFEGSFNYRHIPIFLSLFFINEILLNKNKNFYYFLLGSISVFSFLWSIDVAAYINATLIVFIILLIFNKALDKILIILTSIIIFFLIIFLFVGNEEFFYFIKNTISQYRYADYYNGIIHPEPFANVKNSSRATKFFILFLVVGILIVKELTKKNKKNNEYFLFLIFFYIFSFLNYKTGLSRSDGGHINVGGSLILFLTLFLIYRKFFIYIEKNNFIKIKILRLSFILLILISLKFSLFGGERSFRNIIKFKLNHSNLLIKKDDYFLTDKYIKLKNKLVQLTSNIECFESFNYESMHYLINKKSCTKFHYKFVFGSIDDQNHLISELKASNPKYILAGGPYNNWGINPSKRFSVVAKYINQNYQDLMLIGEHKILVLRN